METSFRTGRLTAAVGCRGSVRTRHVLGERMLTLGVAQLIDHLMGEPPRALHPVVWLGSLAAVIERPAPRTSPASQLAAGTVLLGVVVGMASVTAAIGEAVLARLPLAPRILLRAVLLKPAFAVRELLQAAARVQAPLAAGDIDTARAALRDLVSRDATTLDTGLVAVAAIESLAENASDSMVAPWLAFAVAGLPGAYAYRAVNTLDALVGYHDRYEYLGKPAARCDDLLNVVPARLTAVLLTACALRDGTAHSAWEATLRDHTLTASPNAGWPMAAMAGALRVRLEKIDHYVLGHDNPPPRVSDIVAARRLVARLAMLVGWGAALGGLRGVISRRRQDET